MWRAVQLGQSFHLQHSPLFLVLLIFTMLERLTSFASDVAIERDWLTKLVGESQVNCTQANARHASACSITASISTKICYSLHLCEGTVSMLSPPRLARAPGRRFRVSTDELCRGGIDVCLMSDQVKAVELTVCTPMVF